jgi:hypothetical protein
LLKIRAFGKGSSPPALIKIVQFGFVCHRANLPDAQRGGKGFWGASISHKTPRRGQEQTDKAYPNAKKHSDKKNVRIEHDKTLQRAIIELHIGKC